MTKIVKSVFIEAPVQKIYDYLIDPMNLLEYWPNVTRISDVKQLPNGGYSTRWVYKMAFVKLTGTGVTVDCARNKFIIDRIKGGIDSTQKWTLNPNGLGTMATFEVEYSIPIPVIGRLLEKLLEKINHRDGERLMALLKSKMELVNPTFARGRSRNLDTDIRDGSALRGDDNAADEGAESMRRPRREHASKVQPATTGRTRSLDGPSYSGRKRGYVCPASGDIAIIKSLQSACVRVHELP